ncbi:MAG: hypothetical protein BWY31_00253 [Lentisphaerae bacterium ADurb.Bin242]|nr:MAG: hypothetical protein BWY31_00253 [Lentisphaerae bacterium ADurb.Bin242]
MKFSRTFFRNPCHYAEGAFFVFLTGIILLPMILKSNILDKSRILSENFQRELVELFIGNILETYGVLWSLCFLLILTALVLEFYWEPHTGKKKVLALIGYSLALFFVLFNLFLLSCTDYSEISRRISCISRLKVIGLSLNQYAAENNGYFPPDLETLSLDKASIRCPGGRNDSDCGSNYRYHGKGKKNTDEPFIIVEDRPENHPGTFHGILYSDGQAEKSRRSLRRK